jgi:hypothetical protein
MKSPLNQVTSLQLRTELPDVALKMETQVLMEVGSRLGLKTFKTPKGKTTEISIMLSESSGLKEDNAILKIYPANQGSNGYKKWFNYKNPEEQKSSSTLKVKAKILDITNGTPETLYKIDIEGVSLLHVLFLILKQLEKDTGRKFKLSRRSTFNA